VIFRVRLPRLNNAAADEPSLRLAQISRGHFVPSRWPCTALRVFDYSDHLRIIRIHLVSSDMAAQVIQARRGAARMAPSAGALDNRRAIRRFPLPAVRDRSVPGPANLPAHFAPNPMTTCLVPVADITQSCATNSSLAPRPRRIQPQWQMMQQNW